MASGQSCLGKVSEVFATITRGYTLQANFRNVWNVFGIHFQHQLTFCVGESQFAYRRFHGARDSLTYVVLSWLLAFANGFKVALYCSDVAGVFD